MKKTQPFGRLFLLGTSAAVPTPSRSHPCIALWWRGETMLFDCGEGAQRQLMIAGLSIEKISNIFITHMHGDHVLGLPGLLMTMSLQNRRSPLRIFGPNGLKQFIESCLPMIFHQPAFPLDIQEFVGNVLVTSGKNYRVYSYRVKHSIESYAYCFKEDDRPGKFNVEKAEELGIKPGPLRSMLVKGESVRLENGRVVKPEEVVGPPRPGVKIVYTGDMGDTPGFEEFCRNADILIHEATFDESMNAQADELQHSTCIEAAKLAARAGVKRLILTHISSRYGDTSVILEQAKRFFNNVQVAEDFMSIDIF
ncbi:MAG: ribonuclease Z [Thermoproteota archaeon]|nr:ribonuclease Z [Candidatus Brockarchaeota archaeon]